MKALAALFATVAAVLVLAPLATATAPANDDFADAAALTGERGFVESSTAFATKEAGEPNHAGNVGGHSVWFTWTAPADGTYAFSTIESLFDTLLAVYTGSDVGTLTEVASSDDSSTFGDWSELAIFATEGTTYAIAVDGFGGKRGPAGLSWWRGAPNDLFAHPQVVTGAVGSVAGETFGATTEAGEPTPVESESTVWFEWNAPETRLVKFSAAGTFDTAIGVYTGTSLDALTTIATNGDDRAQRCCNHGFVGFEAVAGVVYHIAVGGQFAEWGAFTVSWSPLVLGTPGPDLLVGTSAAEEIRGLGGNDVIRGVGGPDVLVGGSGNDVLLGGPGNDVLLDLAGRDMLDGGSGADLLMARDFRGSDLLDGGVGRDSCQADRRDIRLSC